MNISEIPIDDLVREAYQGRGEPELDKHPSPVELLRYHTDELSPNEDARIRDHLIQCSDCNRILLDLANFPDVELRTENLRRTPEEEEADWRALEAQLMEPAKTPVASIPTRPHLQPRLQPRLPSAFRALAAVLGACVLGLLFWNISLQQRLNLASTPRVNVYSKDLQPVSTTATRSSAEILRLPGDMEHLLFFLNGADPEHFTDYRVELVAPDGAITWTRSGLRRAPEGNFTIELPRPVVAEGSHQIRLHGIDAAGATLIATYEFVVALN